MKKFFLITTLLYAALMAYTVCYAITPLMRCEDEARSRCETRCNADSDRECLSKCKADVKPECRRTVNQQESAKRKDASAPQN